MTTDPPPGVDTAQPACGSPAHARRAQLDEDSRAWLESLASEGPRRDEAVERLHLVLLRAARFEVARRGERLTHLRGEELEDIAVQSADDALMAVLSKLSAYRGESRFTTWAYKFALLEAAVALRRRAWQGRELPLDPDRWPHLTDSATLPEASAEANELWEAVRRAVTDELTPHQREVLVALTLDDIPIDVLAERLGSTRNALYKTLHDARRKLRARLGREGLTPVVYGRGGGR
ncbi:MAG: RNA polymerase sigma factor [Thermoleophilaceae bacterium]